jgi:uncharacterized protein YciI
MGIRHQKQIAAAGIRPAAMTVLSLLAAALLCAQSPLAPDASQVYFVAFLRPAPDRKPLASAEAERIQSAHMANIRKMASDGVLVAAGPMDDHTVTISGIFVFKTSSLAEAKRIADQDPTVVEHRNTIDVHEWRGPAGIGDEYFRYAKEHPGEKAHMAGHALCIFLSGPAKTKQGAAGAHLQWMKQMRDQGKLAAAGVFEDDPQLAGMAIFKADSAEDANKLVAQDPAVQSGELVSEMHLWWSADRVLPW